MRIFLWLSIALIVGCSPADRDAERKLSDLVARIEAVSHGLEAGRLLKMEVPIISDGEILVIINGNYLGSIDGRPGIDKELEGRIFRYAADDINFSAFFLLIKDKRVVAEMAVPMWNVKTSMEQAKGGNAKVADSSVRKMVIRCTERESPVEEKIDVWNKKCIAQIVGFE
jgi:hypothetical protein